jgi:ribosome biogenesis GTPase
VDGLLPACVLSRQRDLYRVVCAHGETTARLSGKLRYDAEDFPTVGDFVLLAYQESGESRIERLLPRSASFQRLDPSSSGHAAQTVAANFDYVFLLQSLNQDFSPHRLERYLTLSWQSGGTPVVLLTKLDLADDPGPMIAQTFSVAAGVEVIPISAYTGAGIEQVRALLSPGKTAVLLGSSGVGKSSLVNLLMGEPVMETGSIREIDDHGRHTTTHRQLFLLPTGGCVMDTPGMRELGMWDVRGGLEESFADVTQFLGRCRFSDCTHGSEPGCAIWEAIRDGKLSRERWDSYRRLQKEARYADDKEGFLRDRARWSKSIAKSQRAREKAGKVRR